MANDHVFGSHLGSIDWSDELLVRHPDLEAYVEGYDCGMTWPDAWEGHTPGGPWVPSGDREAWRLRDLWLDGWEAGHTEKLRTGRSNPLPGR